MAEGMAAPLLGLRVQRVLTLVVLLPHLCTLRVNHPSAEHQHQREKRVCLSYAKLNGGIGKEFHQQMKKRMSEQRRDVIRGSRVHACLNKSPASPTRLPPHLT
jgi:hypothetical protein